MKFGIGAIFKDEFDYILEWLAWHRLAGFSRFFIADNNSTDGTRQLLEALNEAGFVAILYIPQQVKAQLVAYQTMVNRYYNDVDAIAFIDADEFIVSDDDTTPAQHLESLFSDNHVAAVGLNWRIFGSSGNNQQESGLVIERFLKCARDRRRCQHRIKSVVRPMLVSNVHVHHCVILNDYKYINNDKENITFLNQERQPVRGQTGLTSAVSQGPLRINHYVVKSFQEFTEKKRKRGDVMFDPTREKTNQYFADHDFNDIEFPGASLLADDVYQEMESIKSTLRAKTPFYKKGRGQVNKCNAFYVFGWAVLEKEKPKIMIFVNGKLHAEVGAFRLRPDIMKRGISKDGLCGFHHEFIPHLQAGDVIEISVYANPLAFKDNLIIVE
ncbi:MAG: glycosyltransferase family 2 protein [Methylovulum sp.]|nr:MAG: glycosyltransferase family 2 protein [Methylovulum sp.]